MDDPAVIIAVLFFALTAITILSATIVLLSTAWKALKLLFKLATLPVRIVSAPFR